MAKSREQQACHAAENSVYRDYTPSKAAQEYLHRQRQPAGGPKDLGPVASGQQSAPIAYQDAGSYIAHVQGQPWFKAAFPNQDDPIKVVGGGGTSTANRVTRTIKIAACHRRWVSECEWACLHELARMVTREPPPGTEAEEHHRKTDGHTHAFRWNFIRLVRGMLGQRAAIALRRSFDQQEVPTNRLIA
jgi:hypothetical protein